MGSPLTGAPPRLIGANVELYITGITASWRLAPPSGAWLFHNVRRIGSQCPLWGLQDLRQRATFCRLFRLSCRLTSCCDLSGESPDDGRFPVRPSGLTPSAVRQRAASKAGVTMYLRRRGEAHVTSSRHSQSGGQGERAARSIKRTMQPRNRITPSDIAGRDGHCEWRLFDSWRKPEIVV